MLTKTLPTLDIFLNATGTLKVDIYRQDADFCVEPEETDWLKLEDLAKEFVKHLRNPNTGDIDEPHQVMYAYNVLDALRDSIKIIEDAIYEEDIDG